MGYDFSVDDIAARIHEIENWKEHPGVHPTNAYMAFKKIGECVTLRNDRKELRTSFSDKI